MINGKHLLDYIHPIGSYYIADDGEHPAEKFYKLCGYGGTWEKKEGVFLLASGNNYSLGASGGNKEHNHDLGSGFAKVSFGWEADTNRLMMSVRNVGSYITNTYNPASYWPDPTTNSYKGGNYLGAELGGITENTSNMPPYIVVDVYKRVEDPAE